jgi:hypothetical protein
MRAEHSAAAEITAWLLRHQAELASGPLRATEATVDLGMSEPGLYDRQRRFREGQQADVHRSRLL